MFIKNEIQSNFTIIPNCIFRSKLSPFDRGLLCTLYSLPKDWDISIRGLSSIMNAGRDAIASSLRRLEDAGYIRRYQQRSADGKMSTNVCELLIPSITETLENKGFQPCPENPATYNQSQYNNLKINNIDDDRARAREENTSSEAGSGSAGKEPNAELIDSVIRALEDPNPEQDPRSKEIAKKIKRQLDAGAQISNLRHYIARCIDNFRPYLAGHSQRPCHRRSAANINRFNNFPGRQYDATELERMLLGGGGGNG